MSERRPSDNRPPDQDSSSDSDPAPRPVPDRSGAPAPADPFLADEAEPRRRHALAVVRSFGAVTLADLADEVAVRERGRPLPEIDPGYVLDVYLSLYHDHLPHLLGAGALAYDQERDLVEPGPALRNLSR